MLTIAQTQQARTLPKARTYTDDLPRNRDKLFFGDDSQMELAVSWGGRERSFDIIEFSTQEIVVSGFRVDDLDLCHHEATIDFCDGQILDEVSCRVVFRGFDGAGVARLRVVTSSAHEREDIARFTDELRERTQRTNPLEQFCLAAANWLEYGNVAGL